jgi:HTH-type transcriptional regulator / antitoxin HipB
VARPASSLTRRGALASYERTLTAIMVGSAVRAARKRIGMSQAELARKAGTSQPSIARLEQGRVSPTVISLERIARALQSELVVDFEPLSVPSDARSHGSDRPSARSKREGPG